MCQRVSLYRVKQIMSTHINIIMLIESVSMLFVYIGLQITMSVYMPHCQALYVCIVYTKVN